MSVCEYPFLTNLKMMILYLLQMIITLFDIIIKTFEFIQ